MESDSGSESEYDALEHMSKHEIYTLVMKSGCPMLIGRRIDLMKKEELIRHLVKLHCPELKKLLHK
jgi:hypothetical protein